MSITVAEYLVLRLLEQNVDVVFGVPAVPCARFFEAALDRGMRTIFATNDLEAGYAADGFARFRGLGAVCVSYGVGTLSLVNAIAGAYVERSPVVVINGGPSASNVWNQRKHELLFSHSIGFEDTDLRIFEAVTTIAVQPKQASEAPRMIDLALSQAIQMMRPVYIEIPKDLWLADCAVPADNLYNAVAATGFERTLAEDIVGRISRASRPVVLVGEEVQRYHLSSDLVSIVQHLNVPWATTVLAKSAVCESTAGFVGVYDGTTSLGRAKEVVETADLIVALGCVFPIRYTSFIAGQSDGLIHAVDGWVRTGSSTPVRANISALLALLKEASAKFPAGTRRASTAAKAARPAGPLACDGLTYQEIFEHLNEILDESCIVVCDTCLGLSSAAQLDVVGRDAFLCSAVWASSGHAIAAAIGAELATGRRPFVICGDGGFQMMAQALSTMARYGSCATILVIDNGFYAIEQHILGAEYFLRADISQLTYLGVERWDYVKLAQAMRVKTAYRVDTAKNLAAALKASNESPGLCLLSVATSDRSIPPELA